MTLGCKCGLQLRLGVKSRLWEDVGGWGGGGVGSWRWRKDAWIVRVWSPRPHRWTGGLRSGGQTKAALCGGMLRKVAPAPQAAAYLIGGAGRPPRIHSAAQLQQTRSGSRCDRGRPEGVRRRRSGPPAPLLALHSCVCGCEGNVADVRRTV